MIVCHEHRFIFIKTRKTAGTSIEAFLSSLAGSDAIVTPWGVPEEVNHNPRNWQRIFNPLPELARGRRVRRTFEDLKNRRAFYEHISAALARDRIGRKVWNRYYTFCFERNPWDKAISWYWFARRRHGDKCGSFDEWLTTFKVLSDWNLYAIRGAVAVDFVGCFETLEEDLRQVCKDVGLPVSFDLPRLKTQARAGRRSIELTAAQIEHIRNACAMEINLFGFQPPLTRPTSHELN